MPIDIQTKQIDALNDITKVLIDSKQGYEKAYEMVDDNFSLKPQFLHRAQERDQLIDNFQSQVLHASAANRKRMVACAGRRTSRLDAVHLTLPERPESRARGD